jgi:hypothetical protein
VQEAPEVHASQGSQREEHGLRNSCDVGRNQRIGVQVALHTTPPCQNSISVMKQPRIRTRRGLHRAGVGE